MQFENCTISQSDFLTKFAMNSSKVYKHWNISDEKAYPVFALRKEHFEKGIVRLMKEGDTVMGFFSLFDKFDPFGHCVHWLDHLFIDPKFIGKGFGTLLFNEMVRVAKEELHWESIIFESDRNSAEFYRKMGAKQIGEKPSDVTPGKRSPVFIYVT